MYCKHCGKQIADDSKFCQNCGGIQDDVSLQNCSAETTSKATEEKKIVEIPKIKANLSDTTKWWICGCGIWVVINLYWLFAGDKSSSASEYFQPFSDQMDSSYSYYDITEFIVYVIGLPLIAWGLTMLNKKLNNDSENSTQSLESDTRKDNNDINDALGLK